MDEILEANQRDSIRSCNYIVRKIDGIKEEIKMLVAEVASMEDFATANTFVSMINQLESYKRLYEIAKVNGGKVTGPNIFGIGNYLGG